MNRHLRHAKAEDALAISELVQAGFVAYIAAGLEPSAQQSFLEDTTADKLAPRLSEAAVCLVCEQGAQVVGVIFLPRPTLVQLLFVAPGHLRNGIARALWDAVRALLQEKHPEVTTVELNSSPYAVAAYKALGFFPIRGRSGAKARSSPAWHAGYQAKPLTRSA
jgi:GNAT superfamily N-acetyltransferase